MILLIPFDYGTLNSNHSKNNKYSLMPRIEVTKNLFTLRGK